MNVSDIASACIANPDACVILGPTVSLFVVIVLCGSELLPFIESLKGNGFLHVLVLLSSKLVALAAKYAEERATSTKHKRQETQSTVRPGEKEQSQSLGSRD